MKGLAPAYLTDLVDIYEPACSLHSQGTGLLSVLKVKKKKKNLGEWAFSFHAPVLWNSLPQDIRLTCSVDV